MYGLIGQMKTKSGSREKLIEILLAGTQNMPGCIQYVISKDLEDRDAIWITEIWKTKEDHENSLQLPEVQSAIAKGREFIEGFGTRYEIDPVGGYGVNL